MLKTYVRSSAFVTRPVARRLEKYLMPSMPKVAMRGPPLRGSMRNRDGRVDRLSHVGLEAGPLRRLHGRHGRRRGEAVPCNARRDTPDADAHRAVRRDADPAAARRDDGFRRRVAVRRPCRWHRAAANDARPALPSDRRRASQTSFPDPSHMAVPPVTLGRAAPGAWRARRGADAGADLDEPGECARARYSRSPVVAVLCNV